MRTWLTKARSQVSRLTIFGAGAAVALLAASSARADEAGGEANLKLPDLSQVSFHGMDGHKLLLFGILFCLLGLAFGLVIYTRLKNLAVHKSMRGISELIYETCKTYLTTQGKFLLLLWVFIAIVIVLYFGWLHPIPGKPIPNAVLIILVFSLLGMAGSYSVAWFGIRVNTFANSRTAFAALRGKPYPINHIPLEAGMSVGMMLISVELLMMLIILLFIPGDYAGACFIGFAIGESLGAAALRIAGGIFTKIADIGSDLMKIVFNIKEDDARNPGVIADCTGDNAGDSVGPTADGFETYGVTGVALITFILLAIPPEHFLPAGLTLQTASATAIAKATALANTIQVQLLVWIFVMRIIMLVASAAAYFINGFFSKAKYAKADDMNFEAPLTSLVWITSLVSIGLSMVLLMSIGYLMSQGGLASLMVAEPVFAFGLVAFGFLGMGPVTIAVDSYGPVTDNAQSVFELSLIEQLPGIKQELKKDFSIDVNFERAKHMLEANDGAGNTFKATAKPVLIGTAVVGATTMIFSIIMALTNGLTANVDKLSLLHAPFVLGLITGGAIIYWFTGASTQAVTTGAYRAVEFIKANIKLESAAAASIADSKKVVEICTRYAQKGMLNIFIAVFFSTLAFAFVEPFFFIGYLMSIATFGLYQAIFMANAGGAWDNAKKIVEVELKQKGTPLHDATVIGDTVGDPFKDTSSVALNPIIKFTTLFGLLAVELAVSLTATSGAAFARGLAAAFFLVAFFFVYKSFYGMRIKGEAA